MKQFFKKLFYPVICLGMKLLFPKFKNKEYYTLNIFLQSIKQKLIGVNKNVPWPVHSSSIVIAPNKINPGTKAPGFAIACYINGNNGIIVGENVWIGPRVSIISQNHNLNKYDNYKKANPIQINKNCLLTSNCVILPGVILGKHTVVAANSVVRDSFPDGNQLLAGNPAVVVKKLDDYLE